MAGNDFHYRGCHVMSFTCVAEEDLGNICRRFYDECHRPEVCSFFRGPPSVKLRRALESPNRQPPPSACRIYGVNGGNAIAGTHDLDHLGNQRALTGEESSRTASGQAERQRILYYYGFAVVAGHWCDRSGDCSKQFLEKMGLECVTTSQVAYPKRELERLVDEFLAEPQLWLLTE
jgi:hypothetical protein